MPRRPNRREFLKTSALAGAGFWVAGTQSAWAAGESPNEKLNMACIGVGGMGSGDTDSVDSQNIVALCDVDEDRLGKKGEKFPQARKFVDFRKMLDEMENQIDAVTVSTPDHIHAVAAFWAMQRGKHVFVQKPLTHSVYEARLLTEAAVKYKVATQMGNQGTSENGLREAVEVVQAGAIGAPREVHVWTNRAGNVWPQGAAALLRIPGIQDALRGDAIRNGGAPSHLHWDLWLGPAAKRNYYPDVYHPFKWRGWWDFGTGALGDMACHTANMAFMACKLGYPISLQAEVSELNDETFPLWAVVRYEFPARGDMPPLKWTWYDGGDNKPAWVNQKLKELAHGENIPDSGSLIIGDKGTLFSPNDYGAQYRLLPKADFEGFTPPPQMLPRSPGHKEEWFQAIRGGPPAMSDFSYAGPLTETVVLGCVAMRFPDQRLEWDGPNMRVTNVSEANQYLRREYREGWEL